MGVEATLCSREIALSDEMLPRAGATESADLEAVRGLWAEALSEADGDEAAARILYIKNRESQAEARGTPSRIRQVMSARQELASPAPSDLLWAIVSSLVTIAFVVTGIVGGGFVWAAVAAAVSAIFWWKYLHDRVDTHTIDDKSERRV